jgi:hypothetical protein
MAKTYIVVTEGGLDSLPIDDKDEAILWGNETNCPFLVIENRCLIVYISDFPYL